MNKQQLIEQVATQSKMPKAQVETMLNTLTATIKDNVKKGNDVMLVGFGTFTKSKRKARLGRNPQNGQTLKIPAMWSPKFRAGGEFKALVK